MDKWIALVRTKLRELKLTQEKLAERVGASQGGVGHWLNKRRQPDLETMNKVLHALGLGHLEVALVVRERKASNDDLNPEENTYVITSAFRYPVRDWEKVGEINEATPDGYPAATAFEMSDHYAKGEAFWLQVSGDAMTAPSGPSIAEGMMILVDPAREAEPGTLVVAQWAGSSQATFRKLIEESGQRYLVPLNPTYPKALLTDDCRIIGVVVQATVKF
jgi:SOS-response transcriptional repressor LexA